MKIKNEYIKIKTDREFVLHNYIYDEYLKVFSKSQIETDEDELYEMNDKKTLYNCYIKFDTILEDITEATKNDFDVKISSAQREINGNEQKVNAIYTYTTKNGILNALGTETIDNLNDYVGKKITALGFATNQRRNNGLFRHIKLFNICNTRRRNKYNKKRYNI